MFTTMMEKLSTRLGDQGLDGIGYSPQSMEGQRFIIVGWDSAPLYGANLHLTETGKWSAYLWTDDPHEISRDHAFSSDESAIDFVISNLKDRVPFQPAA